MILCKLVFAEQSLIGSKFMIKKLKVGMRIRILSDFVTQESQKGSAVYHDVWFGNVITVTEADVENGHISAMFPDQTCLRGWCSIKWEEVKKPTIII